MRSSGGVRFGGVGPGLRGAVAVAIAVAVAVTVAMAIAVALGTATVVVAVTVVAVGIAVEGVVAAGSSGGNCGGSATIDWLLD